MATTALILFVIAALGGLVLAGFHFSKRPLPTSLALLHGALAATGLVFLILTVIRSTTAGPLGLSLGILVVAALGGFILFSSHLRKRALPTPLVLIHAAAAVAGVVILLIWVLDQKV